jgi:hypothetical protein
MHGGTERPSAAIEQRRSAYVTRRVIHGCHGAAAKQNENLLDHPPESPMNIVHGTNIAAVNDVQEENERCS